VDLGRFHGPRRVLRDPLVLLAEPKERTATGGLRRGWDFPKRTSFFEAALLIPLLRAAWDDFRTANWLEIIPYPEDTLQQAQQILEL